MSKSKTTLIVIGSIVGLIALSVGIFVARVAFSDEIGAGEAIIDKNSATNRVGAQERFEDLYAEIDAAKARIDVAQDAYERDPSSVNSTNLTGAVEYCLNVVADYNAEARKYSSAEFRSIDLPVSIATSECDQEAAR